MKRFCALAGLGESGCVCVVFACDLERVRSANASLFLLILFLRSDKTRSLSHRKQGGGGGHRP